MITALCRTVILYFLIMIGLRLMGKRADRRIGAQ